MKRNHSPDAEGEGSSRAKMPKTSPASPARGSKYLRSLKEHRDHFISVFVRSVTKEKRHDPKPEWSLAGAQAEAQRLSGHPSPPPTIGDTESTIGPDPDRASSPAADLGPTPTAKSVQPSLKDSSDNKNGDDHSELEEDHSAMSEEDDDDSKDELYNDWHPDSEDSDDEFPWCEELDAFATLKQSAATATVPRRGHRQIGSCKAKLIRRSIMRASFWTEMEQPCQDTSALAFELFDRYGRLNPELYEHGVNKGSGAWGRELNHGDLLVFEEIRVDQAHRRDGVGRQLVNGILERTRNKVSEQAGFFAFARPGALRGENWNLENNPAARREAEQEAEKGAVAFWHAMGFRRVGTTPWLAWTDSPGHPSRQLGIAQDAVHPDLTTGVSLSEEMKQAFQNVANPELKEVECIDYLTRTLPKDFDDDQWQTTEREGNTLLHIAAMAWRPQVALSLLSNVRRLEAARNSKGHTPLEALRDDLDRQRTRRKFLGMNLFVFDKFEGFDAESVETLAALEHKTVCDLSGWSQRKIEEISSRKDEETAGSPSPAEVRRTLRYKYGCTCGQCIGGFLSPRMRHALLCTAELENDQLCTYTDDGPDFADWNADLLDHLPQEVRTKVGTNKSVREGFTNMFSHFARCLDEGMIPTERNVLDIFDSAEEKRGAEWPPVTRDYLDQGGTVGAVADGIFQRAMDQDEWAGDGLHRKTFEEDIDALVACRNDHEFGFVAGMCGYKRLTPYSESDFF